MPLQNRVTPFGELVAVEGRGLLIGNRGVLHDDARRIVRPAQVRRWIACRLAFKGIRRTIMTPRRWTELFFLDEATAFAAGHRPCAECRRADFVRFRTAWERAHGGAPARVDPIDRRLDAERRAGRRKLTYRDDVTTLPDGSYIVADGAAWLVLGSELLAWTDRGYTTRRARPSHGEVEVLTPPSTVAVFRAGYAPAIHPSAYRG